MLLIDEINHHDFTLNHKYEPCVDLLAVNFKSNSFIKIPSIFVLVYNHFINLENV